MSSLESLIGEMGAHLCAQLARPHRLRRAAALRLQVATPADATCFENVGRTGRTKILVLRSQLVHARQDLRCHCAKELKPVSSPCLCLRVM
jgi:hypothetical protein